MLHLTVIKIELRLAIKVHIILIYVFIAMLTIGSS